MSAGATAAEGNPREHGRTRTVAGLPLRATTLADATELICEISLSSPTRPYDIHLVNAYTIATAERDAAFRAVLLRAAMNLPDGKPLAWLSRWGTPSLVQVRGHDLFQAVMDAGRARGLRHYLLGSTEETLARLQNALERRYPGVQIVGSSSPPFRALGPAELAAQDATIAAAAPHVVWVGLGTPKQDFEARRLAHSLALTTVAVGAAFDFAAGTKAEAPAWMTRVGLEWLHRLATEPRRLWKRYLVGNAVFLAAVVKRWNERPAS